MFSVFGNKSNDDTKSRAKDAYEKIASLKSDNREARTARLRMGLLCRAHIDKTFIDGAEKTAAWQALASAAAGGRQATPTPPAPVNYQTVKTASGEVVVYLPETVVAGVFQLGARYQKTEITAEAAIIAVQAIADQLFRYELHMDESFDVLQFLRDELAQPSTEPAESTGTEG